MKDIDREEKRKTKTNLKLKSVKENDKKKKEKDQTILHVSCCTFVLLCLLDKPGNCNCDLNYLKTLNIVTAIF